MAWSGRWLRFAARALACGSSPLITHSCGWLRACSASPPPASSLPAATPIDRKALLLFRVRLALAVFVGGRVGVAALTIGPVYFREPVVHEPILLNHLAHRYRIVEFQRLD